MRPVLEPGTLEIYDRGRREFMALPGPAAERMSRLARLNAALQVLSHELDQRGNTRLWCWVSFLGGELASELHVLGVAEQAFTEASQLATAAGDQRARALALERAAHCRVLRRAFGPNDEVFRDVVVAYKALGDSELGVGRGLYGLGEVAGWFRSLERAEDLNLAALAARLRLAPGGTEVAESLMKLGIVAFNRGELDRAELFFDAALVRRERLVPGTLVHAETLNNAALVAHRRGNLAKAEAFLEQALALDMRRKPESVDVATGLHNLGTIARLQGDLDRAESLYQRALAMFEKTGPKDRHHPEILSNLGVIALHRGELEGAEEYSRRALATFREILPGTLEEAAALGNLAKVVAERGDLEGARDLLQRSLEICTRLAPDSVDLAAALHDMGQLNVLAGDLPAAETNHETALEIRRRLAPGSADEAESLHALAGIHRDRGELEQAAELFARAVSVLDVQGDRLGGTRETRAGFRAEHAFLYREYVEVLLDLGRQSQAFEVFERSRARMLLEILAERDLLFSMDIPAELNLARRHLAAESDLVINELWRSSPGDSGRIEALRARLVELRVERAELVERIRQASPRLAALQYPRPLEAEEVSRALDSGALLLSFNVGSSETSLFVISSESELRVHRIAVGTDQLRQMVLGLRRHVLRGRAGQETRGVLDHGSRLYDTLLAPAEKALTASSKLVIVPDGPLHFLPFAALVRRGDAGQEYLVESTALETVVSATVYHELKRITPPSGHEMDSPLLVAFGDPSFPTPTDAEASDQDPALRSMIGLGFELTPLPGTRREVEALARIYDRRSRIHLGTEATEENAKAVGRGVRYLHFATHGFIDERFPLNSGLALSIPHQTTWAPGRSNGLLQAWEVIEEMRLDADLVVLSACQTGLGRELSGEGLIGLTRAFQYAGARAVVASLWKVPDESTAMLMQRFYKGLATGLSLTEALRQAQVHVLHSAAAGDDRAQQSDTAHRTHPFFWAGFQLVGDGSPAGRR
jgi:CHAT domain-containing protein/Tfp pilus assembly protein PilF